MPWTLYDELIAGVPGDVLVTDYCLGAKWSYVEAESGLGVSFTCAGGAKKPTDDRDFRGLPLKELAALVEILAFRGGDARNRGVECVVRTKDPD